MQGGEVRINIQHSLKFMLLNARSLNNKIDELRNLAKIETPQLIAVTETWGHVEIDDAFYKIDGYTAYRFDRVDRKGGGTIIYITNKLGHRECKALNKPIRGVIYDSSMWCWITPTKGKKILLGVIYRSPNNSLMNDMILLKLIEQAVSIVGENRMILLGDFNVPRVNWVSNTVHVGGRKIERDLHRCMMDNFLHQHVKIPTRYNGEYGSILDLIFTKEEDDVKNIRVINPVGFSDHGVVVGELVCKWKSRWVQRKTRAYYKGNYDNMVRELNDDRWQLEYSNKNTEEMTEHYTSSIKKLIDENVPTKTPKDYNEPWMNEHRMKLWRKKQNSWDRAQENGTKGNWKAYRDARDVLRKAMRKARRRYEKGLSEDSRHNKRAFFKYINSRMTVRPEITTVKASDGTLVESDGEIAEVMVDYFNTVYTDHRGGEMPEMRDLTDQTLEHIEITPEIVEKKLEMLNIYKSCGPDEIHPQVLQKTAKAMSGHLATLYQKSLDEGICPKEWKCANVTPIHKKGDRTEPSNYRPVSLTSQVCKVLESIVRDETVGHLIRQKLLNNAQHGFREGRSCLTNLLETLEEWTKILDDGDCVDVAYLDFRKAFDLVSHDHLIYKLSKYGIRGQVLNWIKDFLKDRSQRVVIRGTASTERKVTSGVPQGSVLGPVLFLIYINDLPLEVESPLSLFADDSKIFSRISMEEISPENDTVDGHTKLQDDLNKTTEWARTWKMEFNVEKCKIMHLGYNNPENVYQMNDILLTATEKEKDLGVLIDNKLDFGKHIHNIVGRANRVLGLVKISFAHMDAYMFLNIYTALVRPLLEYCVQVWSPYKLGYIKLIEGVQRRATKMVPQLKNMSYEERLEKLGLTSLEERRKRGDMIETYKILTGKENVDKNKYFKPARFIGRSHSKKLAKSHTKLEIRKNYFTQRVINDWNNLTEDEVSAKKTGDFKKKYDKHEKVRVAHIRNSIFL